MKTKILILGGGFGEIYPVLGFDRRGFRSREYTDQPGHPDRGPGAQNAATRRAEMCCPSWVKSLVSKPAEKLRNAALSFVRILARSS